MTKITVSDLRQSYDFYTRIVGLKPVTSPDMELPKLPAPTDPEKDFIEIALNYSGSIADPLFLLIKRRGIVPTPEQAALVTLGFKVPDTAAVMERASQAGFKPSRPFLGGGRVGFIKDPDGYTIEFLQPRSFEAR
jgi:catechol 2,3-dioxygenase-like lactoylglutathione lyase family enzyme